MNRRAFTLLETLIYVGLFAIVSTLLIGILSVFTRIDATQTAAVEVSNQATFVLQAIERYVAEASAIELESVSALLLYPSDYNAAPTRISLSGGVINVSELGGADIPITTSRVRVDSLIFAKHSQAPGFDTVSVDLSISYNTDIPARSATRSFTTAISKVNAATFDSNLIPGSDSLLNVGVTGQRWKDAYFSGSLIVNGAGAELGAGVAAVTPGSLLEVGSGGYLQFDKSSAGAPPSGDCNGNEKRGRIAVDTTNNRLYICNGAVRGWDYVNLTD